MFNSINENCDYVLRSVTSNNLKVRRPKSEYLKKYFSTLWHRDMEFSPIQH